MNIKAKTSNLFGSLLFLILGALIFAYPNKVVSMSSIILGTIIICYGIFLLIKNYYETKANPETSNTTLMIGIVTIVIGLLFIILSDKVAQIVQYVLGAWILFNGIEKLILALSIGKNNDAFLSQLIIAILLILAGLYSILKANLTLQIVGLIMMIYAVIEIFSYVTLKNKEVSNKTTTVTDLAKIEITKEEVKDATIVEEKETKKEEKPKKKANSKKTNTKKKKDSSK